MNTSLDTNSITFMAILLPFMGIITSILGRAVRRQFEDFFKPLASYSEQIRGFGYGFVIVGSLGALFVMGAGRGAALIIVTFGYLLLSLQPKAKDQPLEANS